MKEETQPKDLKRSVVTLETQSTSGYRLSEQAAGCTRLKVISFPGHLAPFPHFILYSLPASSLLTQEGLESLAETILKNIKKLSKISRHAWVTSMKEYLSIVLCLVRLHYVTIFLSLYHLTTL